jgi:hypothetical protein
MITRKQINKAIAHTRLRVEGNGDGYFYFICTDTGYQIGEIIYVNRLNHQTLAAWVRDAEEARKSNIIEGFREDGVLPNDLGGFANE